MTHFHNLKKLQILIIFLFVYTSTCIPGRHSRLVPDHRFILKLTDTHSIPNILAISIGRNFELNFKKKKTDKATDVLTSE